MTESLNHNWPAIEGLFQSRAWVDHKAKLSALERVTAEEIQESVLGTDNINERWGGAC